MTTIETNGREIVVVEVPAYAGDFYISGMGFLCHYKPTRDVAMINGNPAFEVDDDIENYKIIGLLSELTAEQCETYINNYFFDVRHKSNTSIQKLNLILKSHEIDTKSPLLIIEKTK